VNSCSANENAAGKNFNFTFQAFFYYHIIKWKPLSCRLVDFLVFIYESSSEYDLYSLCLNFFHLLAQKSNLEKCSIYSNKFFHNFHLFWIHFYLSRASDKWVSVKTASNQVLLGRRVTYYNICLLFNQIGRYSTLLWNVKNVNFFKIWNKLVYNVGKSINKITCDQHILFLYFLCI
jgi:hypothetical protein